MCDETIEMVKLFAELMRQGNGAMLVTDGDRMAWIPYTQIQSGSELTEESKNGDQGDLVIPLWLAESRCLL